MPVIVVGRQQGLDIYFKCIPCSKGKETGLYMTWLFMFWGSEPISVPIEFMKYLHIYDDICFIVS